MNRIAKVVSGAFAGAAALALSVGAVANAQQQAQPAPPPPTEAEIAASPAVKRLKEALAALNSGDNATMLAYIDASAVDSRKPPPGLLAMPLAAQFLDVHRLSRGLDFIRIVRAENRVATAVVRNRLTGDEQPFSVETETQAPHRITRFLNAPALQASLLRPALPGQSEQVLLQEIGSYLKRLGDADAFSGVMMIARDGKPVFSQAYGYADYDKKIPNTIDTPFQVASMTKFFTAFGIGRLVEQGKLSYDDPLSKFVPDYPDPESAKKIKIKHLLTHSAGLGTMSGPAYFNSVGRIGNVRDYMEVAERDPLKFEPGTKSQYSNTGYVVLGRVIEVASGQNYYDYMRKNVFAPAGIKSDPFPLYLRDKVPGSNGVRMAIPYELELSGQQLGYASQLGVAVRRPGPLGGSLHSAPELLKFRNALRAGRVVKPETLRLHTSPKPEVGSPNYGYGSNVGLPTQPPRPFVGHGGNLHGVCAQYGDLTDTPYTLILLSNVTVGQCNSIFQKIVRMLPPTKAPAA